MTFSGSSTTIAVSYTHLGARTSLTIAFFVALIEAVVGITAGVLWGYVRGLDFVFTERCV